MNANGNEHRNGSEKRNRNLRVVRPIMQAGYHNTTIGDPFKADKHFPYLLVLMSHIR